LLPKKLASLLQY